jgi:hypothetical protein
MNRRHIRAAEARLTEAKKGFYVSPKRDTKEHLLCAIRHITKVILGMEGF